MEEAHHDDGHRAKRVKIAGDVAEVEDGKGYGQEEEESTDFKLAILASLHPDKSADVHLDYLLAYGGSTERASAALSGQVAEEEPKRKKPSTIGYQSSLHSFTSKDTSSAAPPVKARTKKGKTLHLYSPKDIEAHTPCTIVHNFLPAEQADALLLELLGW